MVAAAAVSEDYSDAFAQLRPSISASDGSSYREVRRALSPRWWLVWVDMGATWSALGLLAFAAWLLPGPVSWPLTLMAVAVLALLIGVLVHRIGLFVHEGAHGNVAPGRANDPVTNIVAGGVTFVDVRGYRPIHMAHHRHLGTTLDTERTYFQRLDGRFMVRAATGVHAIDVLRQRRELSGPATRRYLLVPVFGALAHTAIVCVALATGHLVLAAAWTLGVLCAYPLVQSLRQLAEHRSDSARGDVDYALVDQGAFTRQFAGARWSFVLGGVGFNRHLLHHWDAGISYTRLGELESWLAGTAAVDILRARQRRYATTLRTLWRR